MINRNYKRAFVLISVLIIQTLVSLIASPVEQSYANCMGERSTTQEYQLFQAISQGDLNSVRMLVDEGVDLESQNARGVTPLDQAIRHRQDHIIRYIVLRGENLTDLISEEITALHIALRRGLLNVVEFYVDNHIYDVTLVDSYDRRPIHYAAEGGNVEVIDYLLRHGADLNARDAEGAHAVHYAARAGHLDLVEFLINRGVDVNLTDNFARNLIHFAAQGGSVEVLEYLEDRGLDIEETDSYHRNAHYYAAQNGNLPAIIFLMDRLDRRNRQCVSSLCLYLGNILRASRGVGIHVADNHGVTAVLVAIRTGQTHILEYMISQGLDVFRRYNEAGSIYEYAQMVNSELASVMHRPIYRRIISESDVGNVCIGDIQRIIVNYL